MKPQAVFLVLSSTFLHAAWNIMAKRGRDEGAFFLRMLEIIFLIGLLPMALAEGLRPSLPGRAWAYGVASGAWCGLYYTGLSRAYGSGDFSLVYPVARALPVLLVGIGDLLRGHNPTPVGWAGMSLVALGCALMPLRSFREFSPRIYLNRTLFWVLLTASGTVGYSMLDKMASELVPPGPGSAAKYGYIFFVSSGAFFWLLGRTLGKVGGKRPGIGWKLPLAGAVFNFGAYWMVLWAYQMASNAGYVVAFRQFSIVIGVALAPLLLGERDIGLRLVFSGILTLGLVLISLWG